MKLEQRIARFDVMLMEVLLPHGPVMMQTKPMTERPILAFRSPCTQENCCHEGPRSSITEAPTHRAASYAEDANAVYLLCLDWPLLAQFIRVVPHPASMSPGKVASLSVPTNARAAAAVALLGWSGDGI